MDLLIKIAIIGDEDSEKYTLLRSHFDPSFQMEYNAFLGTDIFEKQYTHKEITQIDEGTNLTVAFWVLTGNVNYSHLMKSYLEGSIGILILFDPTKPDAVKRGEEWKSMANSVCPNAHILMVGTKTPNLTPHSQKQFGEWEQQSGQKIHFLTKDTSPNQSKLIVELISTILQKQNPSKQFRLL